MPLLQTVTRPTFWRIGPIGEAVFYYLAAVSILVFLVRVYRRVARYRRGSADPFDRLDRPVRRVLSAARLALTNERQFDRDRVAGLMHLAVVWGFLTLFVGTTILAVDMDLWQPLGGDSFFVGRFYLSYSFVMDLMGLFFLAGVCVALWRRYGRRLERLRGRHTGREDHLFLWTLLLLGVGGYLTEALRILGTSATRDVSFETASFAGWFLAGALDTAGATPHLAAAVYPLAWWSHALLALAFVAWLPAAKPVHMLTSFANVVTRDEQAGVRLPGVPEDAAPEDIGPSTIDDFSWKQLLDHDACTKCGRCSDACPAKASGRPLDPRDVILDLKAYRESVDAGGEDVPIVADGGTSVVDAATMESCMACLACVDACPVEIEHVTQFTEMNRRLTESGQMDEHVQAAMMDVFQHGNSFGEPERRRPEWTEDLDFAVPDAREQPVEFLWYVGDYPSYDDRGRAVARSLARVFEAADVSYGILYEEERTAGNDVRRVGEEGLFETLVADNAAAIGACEYETIVCTDPHAYNTFRNEYPEFDAVDWTAEDVAHYTQVVADLVAGGRLRVPATLEGTATYHDPCHLGRYNGEYEAPRELLRATGLDLREMPRNRADSFCCGGGGGGLWMDFEGEKPSEERLREALEGTAGGVDRFVVACPMCMTMYEDGRKTGGFEDDIEVVGLTELLAEAVTAS
ncbi:MAG: (Fe-S)-binding protein [Haloarculaceae archaeon]